MNVTQEKHWKDSRWLITGGSSGLGLALARELDRLGARVVVVARNKGRLQEAIQGSNIHPITADVSAKDDVYRVIGEASAFLGGIDVLVNNASALGPTPLRLLSDTECEDLSLVFETNLMGPFRWTKAALSSMLLRQKGLIINISSDAAQSAYPTWGPYSASKAALDHLTRVWQQELNAEGIQFVAVDPGDMDTPMHLAAIPDADRTALYKPDEVATDLLHFLTTLPKEQPVRYSASEWRTS